MAVGARLSGWSPHEPDAALLEAVARGLADRVERAISQVLVRT